MSAVSTLTMPNLVGPSKKWLTQEHPG